MKRAFDSTGDLGSEDSLPPSAPKIRRAFSDGDCDASAPNNSGSSNSSSAVGGLGASLQDKNRFMSLDILKKRREIQRLRSDLLSATATSRLKEADVTATHVLLSEFDVWLRALLGASGGAQHQSSTGGISSPLEAFLSLEGHPIESVDLHITPLEIDEWSSQEAFEAALLKRSPVSPSDATVSVLRRNIESLQRGLATLLNSVTSVDGKRFESSCAELLRQSEAERSRLELDIVRMKASLKEASKELFLAEKRRKIAEKELDRLAEGEASRQSQVAAATAVTLASAPSVASKDPTDAVAALPSKSSIPSGNMDEDEAKQNSEKIEMLGAQLSVLTKQLEQTDGLRTAAEKALSEYVARDRKDSENTTTVLKGVYEAKIAALDHQLCSLVNDLANSESLTASIESSAQQTIETLTTHTQAKIAELESSLDDSRKNLSIAQAESQNSVALKNQVTELLVTIESMKSECVALREQRKQQIIASERLEKHLADSRAREAQSTGAAGDCGRSAREQELEVELEDARAQVNDLILEIETVMETEEKVKAQIISLHQQLADNQKLQRALIEENVSLKHDVSSRVNRTDDSAKKLENLQSLVTQQHITISRSRETEQRLHSEIHKLRKSNVEIQQKADALASQAAIEAKTIQDFSVQIAALKNQLEAKTLGYEKERSERMKLEVEKSRMKKQSVNSSSAGLAGANGAGPMGDKDRELLSVTLDMLRCSVCRDRFKSVAITRCFHMFCRECIEENLRNRQRKCPACGDKFGQDDVRNVYFTH